MRSVGEDKRGENCKFQKQSALLTAVETRWTTKRPWLWSLALCLTVPVTPGITEIS